MADADEMALDTGPASRFRPGREVPDDHCRPIHRARHDPARLTDDGQRLDRHGAGRIVRKVARRAGITKAVTPHTLRHTFITSLCRGPAA